MWGGVETNLLWSIGRLRLAELVENGRDECGCGAFAFCAGDMYCIESVEIRWLRSFLSASLVMLEQHIALTLAYLISNFSKPVYHLRDSLFVHFLP